MKIMWDLIYLAIDSLPLFWCVHHRQRVLMRNVRLVHSYVAVLYEDYDEKQYLQLVEHVATHERLLFKSCEYQINQIRL